ncbi:MAG TPA: hypothetical protein VFD30_03235 [Terriglobia bacterium]|jgi:hypothetical protein|nr:hypothetical protein [Terriglobia bacterium]
MPSNLGDFVPFAGMLMVVIIVGIVFFARTREKELQAHQALRAQEMEHERRLKEIELEKAKVELEKAKYQRQG